MATIIPLVSSNKGFRPFGAGLATEDVAWVPVNCSVAFTSITSTAGFGNSTGASNKKADNAGGGLRAVVSGIMQDSTSYDNLGFFDAAAAYQPNVGAAWYGFAINLGNVQVREGASTLAATYAYVANVDVLRVEFWDDSVRYFVNATEIYRSAAPAPAGSYYAGVVMYYTNITWRDVKIGGQALTTH